MLAHSTLAPQSPLDQDFPENEVRHYSASPTSDPVNASCEEADFPEKSRYRESWSSCRQIRRFKSGAGFVLFLRSGRASA